MLAQHRRQHRPFSVENRRLLLLTGGKKFTLEANLHLKKRFSAEHLFSDAQNWLAVCNRGGDFFVAGPIFRFEGPLPSILFRRLPPFIHIDGSSDQAAVLRWSLDRFSAEMRGVGVGHSLMLTHLAPSMLLQVLRLYLCSSPKDEKLARCAFKSLACQGGPSDAD